MASGWYDFVAGAKPLATEWDDYISKQVVMVFASAAARTTALSSVLREGMLVYLSDVDRFEAYTGSAWVRVGWSSSAGRTGVTVHRVANQSINNATLTAISWDTEVADTDAFIAVTATTITIPSGLDGLYLCTLRVGLAAGTLGFVTIAAGGANYDNPFPSITATNPSVTALVRLSAANTVQGQVYQASGGAMNITATLDVYRVAL